MAPVDQLALFAPPDPLAALYRDAAALAARLPPGLRMGTSSWSFPGWQGLVYATARSESALARDGLREYARHPLLRTVGIDRGYYAPIPAADLARYDAQLPPGFRACLKAPASVTSAVLPGDPHAAPRPNPDFLNPARYARDLGDALAADFLHRTAVVMFELPPVPPAFRLEPEEFAARLDDFLGALPAGVSYAVELRDARLFGPPYGRVLRRRGVSHVYNYWSAMPSVGAQGRRFAIADQPVGVVRLLLAPGTKYAERKAAFAPFAELRAVDPVMRAEVLALVRQCVGAGRDTYVLVNNKAEGSSPRTVWALAEMLAESAG